MYDEWLRAEECIQDSPPLGKRKGERVVHFTFGRLHFSIEKK
jgi:hypothetical protein